MAHPPYPWWHYACDAAWVAAFLVAAFFGFYLRQQCSPYVRQPCLVSSTALVVLLVSRLLTGSGSGMLLLLLELPTLIVVLFSVLAMVPDQDQRKKNVAAEDAEVSNTGPEVR